MEGEDQAEALGSFRTELNLLWTGLNSLQSLKGTVISAVPSMLGKNLIFCWCRQVGQLCFSLMESQSVLL
jgi:hypothetical protein